MSGNSIVYMNKNLRYLFIRFLKIGAASWGGYMALVAMIEKQICEIDKAIEEEKIVYAVSLASILPGPTAVNITAYIGYQIKGIKGALISMLAVLLPCFILMMALSYLYFNYGNIPAFNNFFAGVTPGIAALLISVVFPMAQKSVKDVLQIIIAAIAFISVLFIHEAYITIFILILSGVVSYGVYKKQFAFVQQEKMIPGLSNKKSFYKLLVATVLLLISLITVFRLFDQYPVVQHYKQLIIAFSSLSISQFGGGYVIIPSMQKMIVDSMHLLTNKEFSDAIAMGKVTPGPIFISAAFVGYKLCGFCGAIVATICMFLPAACIMLFCAKFLNAITTLPAIKASFKGITAAVTGMIAAAGCNILLNAAGAPVFLISIFLVSLLLLTKYKMNPVYTIMLSGIAGLLIL